MSSDNPDIRQQVESNRGTLKKLELLVPGLRGYRQKEDIRVSDSLLRNQVADKLDLTKGNLESLRKQMASSGDYNNLTSIGSLISQVQQLGGEIRHSQQGYSGFAATFQVDEDKLNKLYDYDYDAVNSSIQLLNLTSSMIYDPANPASIQTSIAKIGSMLASFKQKWSLRMEAIENIVLK